MEKKIKVLYTKDNHDKVLYLKDTDVLLIKDRHIIIHTKDMSIRIPYNFEKRFMLDYINESLAEKEDVILNLTRNVIKEKSMIYKIITTHSGYPWEVV